MGERRRNRERGEDCCLNYSHKGNVLQFSTLLFINLRTFLLRVQCEATLYSTSGECLILCLPYTITLFLSVDFCWSKQVALWFFSLFLSSFACSALLFLVLIWSTISLILFTPSLLTSAYLCFVPVLCASNPRPFKDLLLLKRRAISQSHTHTNSYKSHC